MPDPTAGEHAKRFRKRRMGHWPNQLFVHLFGNTRSAVYPYDGLGRVAGCWRFSGSNLSILLGWHEALWRYYGLERITIWQLQFLLLNML